MAWDDPSPRNRVARPALRDPGDLGPLAPNAKPGYAGLDRQGYGDDNATLSQLVGRTVVSLALGGAVYWGGHFVLALGGDSPAKHGIAAVAGLVVAALFMRNLSSGASGWRLGDLFGWLVPRRRRGWDEPVRGGWFARRDGVDVDGPTLGQQVAANVTVDVVEAAIDLLTD